MPESTPLAVSETESRQPVNLLKAYKLRVQHGLSYQEIADRLDQPKASIHRALVDLCRMIDDPGRLQVYTDARAGLLSVTEERMIASLMDEEAISKASLNNRAYAFTQVFNARRLEAGQSTANTSVLASLIIKSEGTLGTAPSSKSTSSEPPSAPQEGA